MEKLLFFGLLFLVHQTASREVIYTLSEAEYSRMPPKIHLDRFEHCLNQPRGVYCTAHADVVSDGPNELLDMMRGYSAHYLKHFNYTNLVYGLCLTQKCQSFFNGSHEEADLKTAAEACLNHSLSAEYSLKSRVTELNCYFGKKSKFSPEWMDWLVALLMFGILALNVVGTVYDVYRDQAKPENFLLMAFSLRTSWKQFVAPPSSDPKMVSLRSINGIRTITAILVVLGHMTISLVYIVDNLLWAEKQSDGSAFINILRQAHLTMVSFFVISGLLLTYNSQIQAKVTTMTWKDLPKAIFIRWLRLTPINAVSLLLVSTWMRLTSHGPLWQEAIGEEVHACRNYWYYNLFYVNNLFDDMKCAPQTWYIACDMQLHIIGLLLVLLAPSTKARWWAMGALCAVGFAWPAYNIYAYDLEATLLANPSSATQLFSTDPTFNWVYKQTHSNMPMYIIGMAVGYLVYDWQQKNVFTLDLTKYRYFYWLLFPAMLIVTGSPGFLFYQDAPRASMGLRLAFGPIAKLMFGTIVILIILGAMFRVENLYRCILEWTGWVPLAKISYCVYTFHVCVIRYLISARTTLIYVSYLDLIKELSGVTLITLVVALVFHLFVEIPFAKMVRLALKMKSTPTPAVKDTEVNCAAVKDTAINTFAVDNAIENDVSVVKTLVNAAEKRIMAINDAIEVNSHTLTEQANNVKDKDA